MCIIKKKQFLSKKERKKITSKLNAWHVLIWPEASSQLFKGNGVWMSTGSAGVMCVKSLLDSAVGWIVQRRIVQRCLSVRSCMFNLLSFLRMILKHRNPPVALEENLILRFLYTHSYSLVSLSLFCERRMKPQRLGSAGIKRDCVN